MTLVRLTDKDRQLGDALLWPVCSEDGTVLIKSGYVIGSSEEIDSLLQGELFFDKTPVKRPPPKQVEAKVAPSLLFPELLQRFSRILDRALQGKTDVNFEDEFRALANTLLHGMTSDQDQWIGTIHLNFDGDYAHYHPLKTAVLCTLIGQRLNVDKETLEAVVCAALTMNISMIRLQQLLYRQQSPLTEQQQKEIFAHPVRSVEMLQTFGIKDGSWLEMVKHHHERVDGTGYPAKLRSDEISLGGKMIMMCEAYCATISPRAYRPGILPLQTVAILQKARGASLDEKLTNSLLQLMGRYPPGCVVRLANGEIGIVTRHDAEAAPASVCVVINANGYPLMTPFARDPNIKIYEIKEMLPFQKLGNVVNFAKIWR
jgi:HD-GYP domain-containing protein (c-di-GMP phosphodiesterase class II)